MNTMHTAHPPATLSASLALGLAALRAELDGEATPDGAFAMGDALRRQTAQALNDLTEPEARRAPEWRAVVACVEALRDALWWGAWVARYGAGTPDSARAEASWEFHSAMKSALSARRRPTGAIRTRAHARAWLDWAGAELHGAVTDSETAQLRTLAQGPMHGAASAPPRTVADALALAVEDGAALLQSHRAGDARYRFDTSAWHTGNASGACAVCPASAIIAARLDIAAREAAEPRLFAPEWRAVLEAVDFARARRWDSAFDAMHGTPVHAGAQRFTQQVAGAVALRHIPSVWHEHKGYAEWLEVAHSTLIPAVREAEGEALRRRARERAGGAAPQR